MDYAWLQPTLERISDLLKLPDLHNCYGCPKVDHDVALNVLDFLSDHMGAEDPTPRIVPTSAGGLHLEWSGILSSCQADFDPDRQLNAVYGAKKASGQDEAGALLAHALMAIGEEQAPPVA